MIEAIQAEPPIGAPGLYRIPIEIYHSDCCTGPSFSSTPLRTIITKSPMHSWAENPLNPDRVESEAKDYFDFGKAAHTLLLGEDGFRDRFVIRPEQWPDWRTKASQEWRDAMRLANKSILTPEDIAAIRGIATNLAKAPEVQQGILNGMVECSLIWQDKATGIWLKSRPDNIPVSDGIVTDLKTCTDASHNAVQKAVYKHGYHMQAALIAMGMKAVLDIQMTDMVFVWAEKKPPYAVNVSILDPDWIGWGMRQIRKAINIAADCLARGEWPAYPSDISTVMPTWVRESFETQANYGLLPEEDNE